MDAVLECSKVTVIIQSYAKYQSYAKAKGGPLEQKDTKCARRHAAAADTTSTTPEKVPVLKTNNYGSFTLEGKFYPLKAFVPKDIYLRKLTKTFRDTHREKKMDQSTNTDDTSNKKNLRENNHENKSLKDTGNKT